MQAADKACATKAMTRRNRMATDTATKPAKRTASDAEESHANSTGKASDAQRIKMSDCAPSQASELARSVAGRSSSPSHCSAKWVVRDLTRAEPSVSCDTKEQAEAWVRHLWEWRPNARPVIEPEISPNAALTDTAAKPKETQ